MGYSTPLDEANTLHSVRAHVLFIATTAHSAMPLDVTRWEFPFFSDSSSQFCPASVFSEMSQACELPRHFVSHASCIRNTVEVRPHVYLRLVSMDRGHVNRHAFCLLLLSCSPIPHHLLMFLSPVTQPVHCCYFSQSVSSPRFSATSHYPPSGNSILTFAQHLVPPSVVTCSSAGSELPPHSEFGPLRPLIGMSTL